MKRPERSGSDLSWTQESRNRHTSRVALPAGGSAGDPESITQEQLVLSLNFVADAGQLMLESSSSVSEVVVRLRELLPALGLTGCSLDADLSSLVLSYWRPDLALPITTMRDVQVGSPLLHRLAGTSLLLDRLERGQISLAEATTRLAQLRNQPPPQRRFAWSALLLSVAGWVVFLYGPDPVTILVALAATLITFPIAPLVRRVHLAELAGTFLSALVLAAVPNLAYAAGVPVAVGPAVVGALFIYLPGRVLVSSVVDGLNNAPLSALARGLQALVTAGTLAVGMLAGGALGTGLGIRYVPNTAAVPLALSALGAAIGILGVAIAWGMPRAQLLPAVAIGTGGWVVASLGSQLGTVSGWFVYAVAAGCVGAVGALTARLRDSAASIYTGVAILPLVPGFTLYQGMLALADGHTAAGIATLGAATVTSLAVAVGVAAGLALTTDVYQVRIRLPHRRR